MSKELSDLLLKLNEIKNMDLYLALEKKEKKDEKAR